VERELGAGALAIRSDISDLASLDAAFAAVRARHGRIDVLFVNAGIGTFAPIPEVTPERWDEVHAVNLKGCFFAAQKALPLMGKGGAIVFTGSIGSVLAVPGNVIYAAAKAGLRAFSQALRRELADAPVRVLHVAPRAIDTPLNPPAVVALNSALGSACDSPDTVAAQIVAMLQHGPDERHIGFPEGLFAWLNGIAPRLLDRGLAGKLAIIKRHAASQPGGR